MRSRNRLLPALLTLGVLLIVLMLGVRPRQESEVASSTALEHGRATKSGTASQEAGVATADSPAAINSDHAEQDVKAPKPRARTSSRPDQPVPDEVLTKVCEVFEKACHAAIPERKVAENWRHIIRDGLRWEEWSHCWVTGGITLQAPQMCLKQFGGPRDTAMPQSVPPAELETWIDGQAEAGTAISLGRATQIAQDFAQRFVTDWNDRNYELQWARVETSDVRVDTNGNVVDAWYSIQFLQVPLKERGEVVVTEAPILVWVDPWTSEILWFSRMVHSLGRIEPRIAFCGPLMPEARARELWRDRMQMATEGPSRWCKVYGTPKFMLQVDVTWDDADIPTGRPIWQVDFGVITIDAGDPQHPGGVGFGGEMKVDAISSEVVVFQIGR